MQIHELTQKKNVQLDEALPNWMDPKAAVNATKKAAGKVGNTISNAAKTAANSKAVQSAGSAIANQFKNPTIGSNLVKGISGAAGAVKDTFKDIGGGVQQHKVNSMANKAAGVWNKYAETLKASTPDPARYATLYKQTLMGFVQKNLLGGKPINSAVNKQELIQAIDAIAAASADPQKVTQLFQPLVQQASLSQQDINSQATKQSVEVLNQDPIIIRFQGSVYGLNDQGSWSNIKTGAVPEQSVEAFLDKAAGTA